jgi:hypothetical protein
MSDQKVAKPDHILLMVIERKINSGLILLMLRGRVVVTLHG